MQTIQRKAFTTTSSFGDFMHIVASQTHFEQCVFDASGIDPQDIDELVGMTQGSKVIFTQCRFMGAAKAVLLGSGDSNKADFMAMQSASFRHCIFEGNSRRAPFVNAGSAYLECCLIKNWGVPQYFHQKSYGMRAKGWFAKIYARKCFFEQESLYTCLTRGNALQDVFGHELLPFLGPGFMRGAYAESNAQIRLEQCHKNRWWIYLQNHHGPYMQDSMAQNMKEILETYVPTLQDLQHEQLQSQ